ncbi:MULTISPECIES: hypothetical protein [Paracoccus]|uniref:Uncharacterized protein n=2 Tax=Paracoccus TaxID=265 RepID=A0A1G7G6M0_9RHOB|nr:MULTISPECIES: hypothetical protein [Paracoccus]TKW65402.1 MAG: hypothetical protein DI616_14605 [Paracoccus denitrificans]WBU58581.1 hypothetical protein PAF18_15900 [Paracoccus sediminicola]WBU62286.1 hypothetical protein PAF20_17895 [Paracoccus albus]SDE83784.1 hypothetical protein SAMN05421538_11274 [Paracoccus isoporae]
MTDADAIKHEAEIANLNANTAKLQAEMSKLLAEGKQIKVSTFLAPFLAAAAVMGGGAALARLFFIGS